MAAETPMPTAARADTRLTYDDFLLFPDDGKRHEIIDGEHYVTPSPNTRHQRLVGRLFLSIGQYLESHPGAGEVFSAPFDAGMIRARFPAGARSVKHRHPAGCAIFYKDATLRMTSATGEVRTHEYRAGDMTCGDAHRHLSETSAQRPSSSSSTCNSPIRLDRSQAECHSPDRSTHEEG